MRRLSLGLRQFTAAAVVASVTNVAFALETIEGLATCREQIAIPTDAVLEVELLDISRADAGADRLASLRIKPPGQVPIPFTLPFDPALIDTRRSYAISARLIAAGETLFRSDTVHPVLTRGAGSTVEVMMVRAVIADESRALPDDGALSGTTWVAEDIDGRGVIDNLESTITFSDDGNASGFGGCNRFSGGYERNAYQLRLGRRAVTMRACAAAVMGQDRRFQEALDRVRTFRIKNGLLYLYDTDGNATLRFSSRR